MLPADCLLAKCPHCGKKKGLLQLISGNTIGVEIWSDTKQIAPMLPKLSPIQKCPHCGRYFLLSKAKTKNGGHESFETGWLTFEEVMASHKDLGVLNSKETATVALATLWAFNDIYRNSEVPTDEQTEMLQAYLRPLMKDGTLFVNKLLNAEVYRELGCFDECLKILTDLTPVNDYVASVADEVKQRALKKEVEVFRIDYKSQIRYGFYEPQEEMKPEEERRKGFWQRVKQFFLDD